MVEYLYGIDDDVDDDADNDYHNDDDKNENSCSSAIFVKLGAPNLT